jgi:glycosyltransferase involved in cell wall biosynthesis
MTGASSDLVRTDACEGRAQFSPRILFVLPTLTAGGAERVVTTLANHWSAAGREVAIATFEPETAQPYYALGPHVAHLKLSLPSGQSARSRAILRTGERIIALRRVIARFKPDIVLSFLTKTNVMSILAATGFDVPVVVSERNNPRLQKFGPIWEMARAAAFPRAAAMVSMTRGALDYYPPRQRPNARVIRNPVSLPADLRSRRNGHTLTAVGRLDKQKRFDRLLDAFALIARDFPDWRLVIWGEGKERKSLDEKVMRLGLAPQVELPGLTAEAGRWVETADLFVLTSDYEGWANVIVEAMAAGVAVVSVDCDYGPKELLGHDKSTAEQRAGPAGIVVPREDVSALADALASLMRDPARREEMGANGAAYAKRFSVQAIAAEWDGLIAEVLNARR